MRDRISAKGVVYFILLFCCVALAVVARRMELMAAAVPFLVALIAGVAEETTPVLEVSPPADPPRAFEGDEIRGGFLLRAGTEIPLFEIIEALPADAVVKEGNNAVVSHLFADEERQYGFTYALPSRRNLRSREIVCTLFDRTGFRSWEQVFTVPGGMMVFPKPYAVKETVNPLHTQVYTGNYPSATLGEGLEFADVRSFSVGDKADRINWRLAARTGRLYVNEYITERNTDIVLLMDSFADLRVVGESLMDYTARGAATLAFRYLHEKNRVGLVEFGAYLRYVLPAPGIRQWYKILSNLAEMMAVERYVAYEIRNVPPRILPSRALIIALTGLLDDRFAEAVIDLRRRGFDVAVICVPPADFFRIRNQPAILPDSTVDLSTRLWRMVKEEVLETMRFAGVGVVRWNLNEPFDLVVRELNALRREMRRRR
jgi:uncharacterized protein (DUF58 family)